MADIRALATLLAMLGGESAATTSYDNTASGLTAENLQDALDELHEEVEDILGMIGSLENLDTEAKANLVAAINEVYNTGGGGGEIGDVRIDGTSVVSGGVANIPKATSSALGVVKSGSGTSIGSDGAVGVVEASESVIKSGSSTTSFLTPNKQHASAFYALAKAAGDSTQAASSNPVGTYTASAKTAIATMLGVATAQALSSHTGATNNPHSVTPAQIGAATAASLTSHTGNTSNPHNVTAEQVGAYTKTAVDDLLESLSGHGTALAATDDANNITNIGRYRAGSTAVASAVANLPVPVVGALIVLPTSSADNSRLMQMYIPNWATTNQIGILYIRQRLSSGWGDWYKLGDTTPTAIGSTSSGAFNITDLDELPKRDAEYYTLTGSETSRITNKPSEVTDGSIRVEVKFITGGAAAERCVQTLYVANGEYFYQRAYGSSGWSSWYKFSGTAVS